jgi:hypothetical protein
MKKFFISFGLVLILFGGFVFFNLAVVYCSGELISYNDIAMLQQKGSCKLYGPLFNNKHDSYKYALYAARDSDIVLAGSSRALQYQQGFFTKSMVNCGRIIASLRDAVEFLEMLSKQKRPQTIILVADYWWFMHPLRSVTGGHQFERLSGEERSIDMFFLPVWYGIENKISLTDVFGQWLSGKGTDGLKRIGFRAISTDSGFTEEGAYSDERRFEPPPTCEAMLKDINARAGKERFSYHNQLEPAAVEVFFDLVEKLRKHGDKVIVLFPPASPVLFQRLQEDPNFAYALKTIAYASSFGAYDLNNPNTVNVRCEDFYDFFHTTPKIDARVLLKLRNIPELKGLLNIPYLNKIADFSESHVKFAYPTSPLTCSALFRPGASSRSVVF